MKTNIIGKLITLALLAAVTQTGYAANRGGGGFRGGFHSVSATRPGFNRGNTGTRFAFGARPSYGRPVYVRPPTSVARSSAYSPRNSVSTAGNRTASTPRVAPVNGSVAQAGTHVYSRQGATWRRDWDRRSAHHWNGHWWAWDGSYWVGLEAGYYPWDYFPYYAYDYYPYDYYPGYYADVEPYYNGEGVADAVPAPDDNVAAVQKDLTRLGYYRGPIDGLYGRATRDGVAHYQAAKHIAVTGTLTRQTLQSLGVQAG